MASVSLGEKARGRLCGRAKSAPAHRRRGAGGGADGGGRWGEGGGEVSPIQLVGEERTVVKSKL